jgi:tetraacyldisaccharide 4'-kinase
MLKILLAPFALIYGFAVKVRNLLFDYRILKSTTVGRPTICVGNLTVGGTGKTPHVEYLVNLLATKHKVATLSRGYKRQTKGFLYADVDSTSQQVGDEPLQIKTKFPDAIVAVNGNRVEGAQRIIKDYPDIETIILDDAFQHRSIKPGFSILLMDFNNLVTKDYFLPVGRLRDSLKEIRRADIVVVTKCPVNIKPIDQRIITTELNLYPYQTIFFSWFEYGDPIPVFKDATSACKVIKSTTTIALAGIANPFPFFQHLEEQTTLVQKNAFPDHYPYSEKKIKAIFESLSGIDSNNKAIITTEKDAARLKNLEGLDESVKRSIFYIPIEVAFSGESAKDFNKKIEDYVRTSKRDYGLHTK